MNILLLFCLPVIFSQPTMLALLADSPSAVAQWDIQDDDAPKDFSCGHILVRGVDQFTPSELCRLLDQTSTYPHDLEMRQAAQTRIIAEYQKRGFFDIRVTWDDITQKTDEPIVSLVIREGKVYIVRRMELLGNITARDHTVRHRIPLQEGSPYDEDLLELGIKRINQLGILEEITRENVKMYINQKGHFVDFTFMLKEK
jgi:outer membrane protein assembly factor BamA